MATTPSSVIFIGSPEKTQKNLKQNCRQLFFVSPSDLIFRIFAAFVPPFNKKYQKVYVDLLGPLLALLILVAIANYGYSYKAAPSMGAPTESVLIYCGLVPILVFILCKLGHSSINFCEIVSLQGYALYGHIFTLFVSFLCFEERSNFFFFLCLIVIDGLGTLRVALVILSTLNLPAARLLICSIISIVNILFAIFLHFAYMHSTYTYRNIIK